MVKITSRTAIENSILCARKGFYSRHALGTGLVPSRTTSVDLIFGIACHKAVEILMGGGNVDDAVAMGIEVIGREEKLLVRADKRDFEYRDDLKALVELIVRLFHSYALPSLLETYNIISVEKERPIILVDDIIIETKADAILEEKESGRKLAFSLKTCGRYDEWLFLRDRLALQNFTEPWAYQCDGVQMCYLQKGLKGEKFPFEGNSLLYPWTKKGQWSWTWFFTNDEGKRSAIGPSWERVRAWDHWSIKDWIQFISEAYKSDAFWPFHRVDPWKLGTIIPLPSFRHKEEIDIVIKSLKVREEKWFKALAACNAEDQESLELHFPREFTACASLTGMCDYYNACKANATPQQLVQMGMIPRTPHHEIEREAVKAYNEQ